MKNGSWLHKNFIDRTRGCREAGNGICLCGIYLCEGDTAGVGTREMTKAAFT